MAEAWTAAIISVGIVSLLSFIGLMSLPFNLLRRHSILFSIVALAAGTLLGDTFLHLVPETIELWGEFNTSVAFLILGGFLAFYVIESLLRIGHAHGGHHQDEPQNRVAPFGVLNLVGDGVHNFLDGVVIGAAYLVDFNTGLATTIAVAVHEIPQEVGDFGVLLRAGFRVRTAALFNLLSALMAMIGVGLILLLTFETEALEQYVLPIVAGGFLYIAAADLIPELQHHSQPRVVPLVIVLLAFGVFTMWLLTFLEV